MEMISIEAISEAILAVTAVLGGLGAAWRDIKNRLGKQDRQREERLMLLEKNVNETFQEFERLNSRRHEENKDRFHYIEIVLARAGLNDHLHESPRTGEEPSSRRTP
jgi:hypothetical protein